MTRMLLYFRNPGCFIDIEQDYVFHFLHARKLGQFGDVGIQQENRARRVTAFVTPTRSLPAKAGVRLEIFVRRLRRRRKSLYDLCGQMNRVGRRTSIRELFSVYVAFGHDRRGIGNVRSRQHRGIGRLAHAAASYRLVPALSSELAAIRYALTRYSPPARLTC